MKTKRFVAADMRRALTMVRDDLGEDAMILSTQRTAKGVEIIASIEELEQPSNRQQAGQAQQQTTHAQQKATIGTENSKASSLETRAAEKPKVGLASGKTQDELAEELEAARRRMLAMQESQKDNITLVEWAKQQPSQVKPLIANNQAVNKPTQALNNNAQAGDIQRTKTSLQEEHHNTLQQRQDNKEIQRLHEEISSMRTLFENQLMAMSAAQERQYQEQKQTQDIIPVAAHIKQKLANLGLTQACNDQIIRSLRMIDDNSISEEALWKESLARLARSIPAISNDPVATGGIYAFLGTTGVGKTTTIAKLAARYVMEHGAEQVALLTTDTFRIGAHDQLRSLGRILNVTVKVVDDLEQLPAILKSFHKQALVLIDTPGMSYNDPLLGKHMSVLRQCPHVQTSLVLSANSQYQMMQASLHSYRLAKPRFCVMTKLDECASLGDAISLLASNELSLAYITDGQAVPDDLSILKPHQLITKAVSLAKLAGVGGQQQSRFNSAKNPA